MKMSLVSAVPFYFPLKKLIVGGEKTGGAELVRVTQVCLSDRSTLSFVFLKEAGNRVG